MKNKHANHALELLHIRFGPTHPVMVGAPMRPYQMCTKTVMDTTDPDIVFDENGVCQYYEQVREAIRSGVRKGPEGEKALEDTAESIRRDRRHSRYDSIIGLSGGVDSTYLCYLAKELGLNPLIVHFDNGWNSSTAVRNIEATIRYCGFDLYTFVMDWEEFRDIQRAYFLASVLDLEVPTDQMILGALLRIARRFKIKHILSGNNLITEMLLPKSWYYPKFDATNLRDIYRKFGSGRPLRAFPSYGLTEQILNETLLRLKIHMPLNLMHYRKNDAIEVMTQKMGWEYYGGKHYESIFTRFYQGYILPSKFNIDKRKAHLSNLICAGEITRDEALTELSQPTMPPELATSDKIYIAKKLGWTEEEFEQVLRLPNRRHEDFATDQRNRRIQRRLMRTAQPLTRRVKSVLKFASSIRSSAKH